MAMDKIRFLGCREGNLKNVDVSIPYGQLVAITGVSGSGKSSFAFDTMYAEGRRQFLETLDAGEAYYLSKSCSADLDMALGLPPTIAVRQNKNVSSSFSTIGTITHMNPYLQSIFASCGESLCMICSKKGRIQRNLSLSKNCPQCGASVKTHLPSFFSNMSPNGMCQFCSGTGKIISVDETLLYPNQEISINQGGLKYGVPTKGTTKHKFFENLIHQIGADLDTPIKNFSNEQKVALLYGIKKSKKNKLEYEGLVNEILKLYRTTTSSKLREQLTVFLTERECEDCGGAGISFEAQNVTIEGHNICNLQRLSIEELYVFFKNLTFGDFRDDLILVAKARLLDTMETIIALGIGYLNLVRKTASLSGGEMHRLLLATMVASRLSGVMYVLDEPSVGLHYCEIPNLVSVMKRLNTTGNGNTVVYVEHNPQLIRLAQYLVEFGPGPSYRGGQVIYQGALSDLNRAENSLTAKLLSGTLSVTRQQHCKVDLNDFLGIRHANSNNLKDINVDIPLHCLVAITGVSGSGKSSLVFDTLSPGTKGKTSKSRSIVKASLVNRDKIGQIITCTQTPIGKSYRSVVSTYLDIMPRIRARFVALPAAQKAGLDEGCFSFNSTKGACPQCGGFGFIVPEGYFMGNVRIKCPLCGGNRFKDEILRICEREKNISDVLNLDIVGALEFFTDDIVLQRQLKIMLDVGLDYLRLGQSITELSGGECQRLKLAADLMHSKQPKTLYIFDEPSAGLHIADLQKILSLFDRLLASGHSVVFVDHNIDLIALSDYVIDLGPGAGEAGGRIIACGTPRELAACDTPTGKALCAFSKAK